MGEESIGSVDRSVVAEVMSAVSSALVVAYYLPSTDEGRLSLEGIAATAVFL